MSDFSLVSMTNALETVTGANSFLTWRFAHADWAESEHARLEFELEGQLSFRLSRTMTEDEMKHHFVQLAEHLAARTQAHLIIESVPAEVLPAILPQLQDMADYEIRMWQVRQKIEGPDIRERWVSLPITA
jgi:hypothetical protein